MHYHKKNFFLLYAKKKSTKKCDQFDWKHVFTVFNKYFKNNEHKNLLKICIQQLEHILKKENITKLLDETKKILNGDVKTMKLFSPL